MKLFLLLISAICALAGPTAACFGPKLYLGVADGLEGDLQHALVALYVKEKTGTEVEKVVLTADQDPRDLIASEKVDFSTVDKREGEEYLLTLTADTVLLGGKRIKKDLQFTTTIPALNKLDKQLSEQHYAQLLEKVKQGAAPLALVRQFYFDRGWI